MDGRHSPFSAAERSPDTSSLPSAGEAAAGAAVDAVTPDMPHAVNISTLREYSFQVHDLP